LCAVFSPCDIIALRWIETWTENGKKKSLVKWQGWPTRDQLLTNWDAYSESVDIQRAHQFFGVCPRFGTKEFDLACQIRTVRTLWADVDDCGPEDAATPSHCPARPSPSTAATGRISTGCSVSRSSLTTLAHRP